MDNRGYDSFQYNSAASKEGCLSFAAPSASGTFEFRYLPKGGYETGAVSNTVVVR
jgi:hypothetical protein